MIHIILHVLVPLIIARWFYARNWLVAFMAMGAGIVIDVDHLLADPIYDAQRCSIGFHPLHTFLPIGLYVALFAHEKTRLIGLGLCVHILLDASDCVL